MSVSLQAVTFGLSFCHRQFCGAVNSRALRREHRLTTSLGRRWPVLRFRLDGVKQHGRRVMVVVGRLTSARCLLTVICLRIEQIWCSTGA